MEYLINAKSKSKAFISQILGRDDRAKHFTTRPAKHLLHVLLRAKHLQLNSNTLSYYPWAEVSGTCLETLLMIRCFGDGVLTRLRLRLQSSWRDDGGCRVASCAGATVCPVCRAWSGASRGKITISRVTEKGNNYPLPAWIDKPSVAF